MTRKVLLDTNLLIAAFDQNGTTAVDEKRAAISELETLLADPETQLFITPLVRYEVLRGIQWQSQADFETVRQALNAFPELEITRTISELAANLFRFDSHCTRRSALPVRNIDKRKFDVFHFCSARCNGLAIFSRDSDIAKIRCLHDEYQAQLSA